MSSITYVTGRQRTLILSGEINTIVGGYSTCSSVPVPGTNPPVYLRDAYKHKASKCQISAFGITIEGGWASRDQHTSVTTCPQIQYTRRSQYRILVPIVGGTIPHSLDHSTSASQGIKEDYWDIEGEYSISIDLEEVITVDTVNHFNQILDTPMPAKFSIYERPRQGGSVTISISGGGHPPLVVGPITIGSAVGNFPVGGVGGLYSDVTLTAISQVYSVQPGSPSPYSGSIGVTANIGGSSLGYPRSETLTVGSDTVDTSSSSGAHVSVTGYRGGYLQTTLSVPRTYSVYGVVRAMDEPYPQSLNIKIQSHKAYNASSGNWENFEENKLLESGEVSHAKTQNYFLYQTRAGKDDGNFSDTSWVPPLHDLSRWQDANPLFKIDERCPVKLRIDPDSLTTSKEDTSQSRITFRGWRWDAMTVMHAKKVVIDTCDSLNPSAPFAGNWSVLNNPVDNGGRFRTLIEAVGGRVRVYRNPAYTGNDVTPVSIRRSFSPDASFTSYRHLKVYFQGNLDDIPSLDGFSGVLCNENGSPVAIYDLSSKHELSTESSNRDSRWPLRVTSTCIGGTHNWASDYLPDTESPLFGLHRCSYLDFVGVPPTADIYFDGIEILRESKSSLLEFLPAFYRGVVSSDGRSISEHWPQKEFTEWQFGTNCEGRSNRYARRGLLALTDGQQGLEIADSRYQLDVPPSGGGNQSLTYSPSTINQAVDDINFVNSQGMKIYQGWQATNLLAAPNTGCTSNPPMRDCFLNSSRPPTELYGGGAFWSRERQQWEYRFGDPIDEFQGGVLVSDGTDNVPTTIPAQLIFDEIDWHPRCGDIFEHLPSESQETGLVLRAAAILRSGAHGLIFKQNIDGHLESKRGIVVRLTDTTENPTFIGAGSGKSDAQGYYRTGLPFMTTQRTGQSEPIVSYDPVPFITQTYYSRKRQRSSFVVAAIADLLPGETIGDSPNSGKSGFSLYYPYAIQAGDPLRTPSEPWREIGTDIPRETTPAVAQPRTPVRLRRAR